MTALNKPSNEDKFLLSFQVSADVYARVERMAEKDMRSRRNFTKVIFLQALEDFEKRVA